MFGVSCRDYRVRVRLPFALPARLLSHDRKPDPKLILPFFPRERARPSSSPCLRPFSTAPSVVLVNSLVNSFDPGLSKLASVLSQLSIGVQPRSVGVSVRLPFPRFRAGKNRSAAVRNGTPPRGVGSGKEVLRELKFHETSLPTQT